MKKFFILFFILAAAAIQPCAQNINGEKILVGRESITIINFPEKVLNINFSDDAAYDYYIPKRREERSISLQFNKEQKTAPNTGLLVNEGGRSHMFRLVFDSTYNINDDSRPPLWYDHSNLKDLKAFVQKQKELMAKGGDDGGFEQQDKEQEVQRKKEMEDRKASAMLAQKQNEANAAQKAKDADKQRKEAEAAQKEQQAAIEEAKKEAAEKEKQLQLAQQKEAAARKAADEKAKKEAEELARQQATEEQRIKELKTKQEVEALAKEKQLQELKARQDAEALAKAQKEKELKEKQAADELAKAQAAAAEKKRLQEAALAKKKAQEEEQRRLAAEAFAKKEAEKKAAEEKLAQLEAERKQKEAEKAYSEVGLWQRYGKKGIDVYNIPAGQMAAVNADFFIAADTLRNFLIADSLINNEAPDKLNIAAGDIMNGGVKISLEHIFFKDIYTYYKVKIDNTTNEDFLMGKTYMYWYDEKEQPKMIIKGSYLTYISFYPIVRPHTARYIVFATRSPNVTDNESLVLFMDERRKEKGGTSIVIPGKAYVTELAKVQTSVTAKNVKSEEPSPTSEKPAKKNKKKRSKD
ncbi:MAG: hypothetical protein QM640_11330 [Niabella sp.]